LAIVGFSGDSFKFAFGGVCLIAGVVGGGDAKNDKNTILILKCETHVLRAN
jgi:hypothetical protein